ncbi:ABC transporter permease [Variovorax ureilyticus]|uniref:ABC transporter permease n=1 Tax=Variovorax ureilyticus TaxID=1836198 RepID=A0ABU8VPN4_9BURK
MNRFIHLATSVIGVMVIGFLMLPILAVVPASFNHASFIQLPPTKVSLRWYEAFLADSEWYSALFTSIEVAILATILSVALGTSAAIGLLRTPSRLRGILSAILISPLVVPVIISGIALYYVMRPLGLHGTLMGLAMGHAVLALPFVVVNVGVALRGIEPNCMRAAEGLGASPFTAFRTITLPLIGPGLASGAAFAFITSFDEVVVSIFLSSATTKTLSVKMWEIIRVEYTPITAVASTILMAVTLLLFAAVKLAFRQRRVQDQAHAG